MRHDVIVVGGGFAGVTAAREAALRGRSVLLLEARDRLGGRTWSADWDGIPIEDGGARGAWAQPHTWAGVTPAGPRGGGSADAQPAHRRVGHRRPGGGDARRGRDARVAGSRSQTAPGRCSRRSSPVEMRLATPVAAVRAHGGRVEVETRAGAVHAAAAAVVAVPLNVLGAIEFEPALSEGKQEAITLGQGSRGAKIFLRARGAGLRENAIRPGHPFGYLATEVLVEDGTTLQI